jgi:hypothetical protein
MGPAEAMIHGLRRFPRCQDFSGGADGSKFAGDFQPRRPKNDAMTSRSPAKPNN